MLNTSEAFKNAIVADSRRIKVKATMDIVDPDISYGVVTGSAETAYSVPAQLHDGKTELTPYATLENNRWVLDGTFALAGSGGEIGFETSSLTNTSRYVSMAISNVGVLQGLTVFWPNAAYDGLAEDFTVEVRQSGTAYFTKAVTGNTNSACVFKDFTVYYPDEIRITVTKWSMNSRRMRVAEIMPGLHTEWTDDDLAEFSLRQQADFSCISLPYGTAELSIDNSQRTFEPRSRTGLMQSIEERQGIRMFIGAGGEYVPLGTFYQYKDGWRTSGNALTMKWSLVDIIGLLVDRAYTVPSPLPTTLEAWISSITAQLGQNFANAHIVDPNYAAESLTVLSADAIGDTSCGQMIMWCCQATGTFPRADAATGKLAIEPFWSQGNLIDLDNVEQFPVMTANSDIAFVRVTATDGTVYTISGTSESSPNTVELTNPFIHTQAQAMTAAREIISIYGGNQLTTIGRGNPSSEIGDVPTVQLDRSNAVTGRLTYQDFVISDGVLKGCTSRILQSSGADLYENVVVINEDDTWTVPAGTAEIRVILVGGGYAGGPGGPGTLNAAGENGTPGSGGKVYYGNLNFTAGQTFTITIGAGGTAGTPPGDTTIGSLSSANGTVYVPSFTDAQSGAAYGRTGVADPAGNGDGGAGGQGGNPGAGYVETTTTRTYTVYPTNGTPYEISEYVYNALAQGSPTGDPEDIIDGTIDIETTTTTEFIYTVQPGNGQPGVNGGHGCAVIYWR